MNGKFSYRLILFTIAIASLASLTACGGNEKNVASNKAVDSANKAVTNVSKKTEIALNKVGLNGEFDENGMAKRVAKAIEAMPNSSQNAKVYVAQAGNKIVLKGNVSDRQMLDRIVAVAQKVKGVSSVNSDGVTIR